MSAACLQPRRCVLKHVSCVAISYGAPSGGTLGAWCGPSPAPTAGLSARGVKQGEQQGGARKGRSRGGGHPSLLGSFQRPPTNRVAGGVHNVGQPRSRERGGDVACVAAELCLLQQREDGDLGGCHKGGELEHSARLISLHACACAMCVHVCVCLLCVECVCVCQCLQQFVLVSAQLLAHPHPHPPLTHTQHPPHEWSRCARTCST